MKEILQLGDEMRQDGIEPEIIKLAIELVLDTELTLALTELNEWVEQSKKADVRFD